MRISIDIQINTPLSSVWDAWTLPNHIIHWNFASDDWHCPEATSDFKIGGEFHYTMAAKDGSVSFDFWGRFISIQDHRCIEIVLGDDRKVRIEFIENNDGVLVKEDFEPESENSIELQKSGWLAILNNFKNYTESLN